jgi:hypothetical protein
MNSSSYTNELRFIRATDLTGTAWSPPVTIATHGVFEQVQRTNLRVVSGNPGVFYVFSRGGGNSTAPVLRFARATNADGSAWGTPVSVASTSGLGSRYSVGLVGGQLAVGWFDSSADQVQYLVSSNNGASFNRYAAYDYDGPFGLSIGLVEVQGRPALTFSDGQNRMYLRDGTPIVDTFINWIAVAP